jgi:hypothetical protein
VPSRELDESSMRERLSAERQGGQTEIAADLTRAGSCREAGHYAEAPLSAFQHAWRLRSPVTISRYFILSFGSYSDHILPVFHSRLIVEARSVCMPAFS